MSSVHSTAELKSDPASSAVPVKPKVANEALAEALDRQTAVGSLWRAEGERIRCVACGHRCLIGEGRHGICKVRFNRGGQLRVPFGYVAGVQSDPVEKKPFFPCLSRERRPHVWDAGLRFSLFVLPELGDEPGVAG